MDYVLIFYWTLSLDLLLFLTVSLLGYFTILLVTYNTSKLMHTYPELTDWNVCVKPSPEENT